MSEGGDKQIIHTLVSELVFENNPENKNYVKEYVDLLTNLEKKAVKSADSLNKLNKAIKNALSGRSAEKIAGILNNTQNISTAKTAVQNSSANAQIDEKIASLIEKSLNKIDVKLKSFVSEYKDTGGKTLQVLEKIFKQISEHARIFRLSFFGNMHPNFIESHLARNFGKLPKTSFFGAIFNSIAAQREAAAVATQVNAAATLAQNIEPQETPGTQMLERAQTGKKKKKTKKELEIERLDATPLARSFWEAIKKSFDLQVITREIKKQLENGHTLFGFQFMFASNFSDKLEAIKNEIWELKEGLPETIFQLANSLTHHLLRAIPGITFVLTLMLQKVLKEHREKQMQLEEASKYTKLSIKNGLTLGDAFTLSNINSHILGKEYDNEELINATGNFANYIQNAKGLKLTRTQALNLLVGTVAKMLDKGKTFQEVLSYLSQFGLSREVSSDLLTNASSIRDLLQTISKNQDFGNLTDKIIQSVLESNVRSNLKKTLDFNNKVGLMGGLTEKPGEYLFNNAASRQFISAQKLDSEEKQKIVELAKKPLIKQSLDKLQSGYALSNARKKEGWFRRQARGAGEVFGWDSMEDMYEGTGLDTANVSETELYSDKISAASRAYSKGDFKKAEKIVNEFGNNFIPDLKASGLQAQQLIDAITDLKKYIESMAFSLATINNKTKENYNMNSYRGNI